MGKTIRFINSPSNPTFATELHLVTGLVTMTTCSSHVFWFDLYFLKKRRTNFFLQLHKQLTSSVQIVNTNDPPKTPVVRRIAETMQSYHTSDFVFEFGHTAACFLVFDGAAKVLIQKCRAH